MSTAFITASVTLSWTTYKFSDEQTARRTAKVRMTVYVNGVLSTERRTHWHPGSSTTTWDDPTEAEIEALWYDDDGTEHFISYALDDVKTIKELGYNDELIDDYDVIDDMPF